MGLNDVLSPAISTISSLFCEFLLLSLLLPYPHGVCQSVLIPVPVAVTLFSNSFVILVTFVLFLHSGCCLVFELCSFETEHFILIRDSSCPLALTLVDIDNDQLNIYDRSLERLKVVWM